MGFGCTIKAGKKELTKYPDGLIHCQLLDLGPNGDGATDAPYRVSDFRNVVSGCIYGDILPKAAADSFIELQRMAKENLDSLIEPKHCESCTCCREEKRPEWWSADALRSLLDIDPQTVTYMKGGY